jgi:hypothetical protein
MREAVSEVGEQAAASLRALAAECRRAAVERQVLLLRLSLLPADYYRPHHGRLAESAVEKLARADRALLYRLPGNDLALVWRGEAAAEQGALAALRTLFAGTGRTLPPFSALVRRFVLPRDAAPLGACLAAAPGPAPAPKPRRPALDLAHLVRLERALVSADMEIFARRRPVCRRDEAGSWRVEWEKRLLCAADLAASLAPEHDLLADSWLFRRLTRTLDRRMLALLAAPGEIGRARPFAVDLNVESILSPAFLAFDAALPAGLRGTVLLGLLPADILADAAAFRFARDFARGRGYRLIVRGISASVLPAISLAALGLDFLELEFSPALPRLPPCLLGETPQERGRIVLCRADTEAALAWGEAAGLRLFEGRMAAPEM